ALRSLRAHQTLREPIEAQVQRRFSWYKLMQETRLAANTFAGSFANQMGCGTELRNIATDAGTYAADTLGQIQTALQALATTATGVADGKRWTNGNGYNDFNATELRQSIAAIDAVIASLPPNTNPPMVSEDAPLPFDVALLPDHLDQVASADQSGRAAQFVSMLSMRIRGMLADPRLASIVNPSVEKTPTFQEWLESYIGKNDAVD